MSGTVFHCVSRSHGRAPSFKRASVSALAFSFLRRYVNSLLLAGVCLAGHGRSAVPDYVLHCGQQLEQ